jgi:broad-specificity NMP kinase
MVLFGQIVIGPPGCGKTTYCMGMQMFAEAVGRNCKVVNMDFANDSLPYTAAIDVRELVSLEVREEEGGLIELHAILRYRPLFLCHVEEHLLIFITLHSAIKSFRLLVRGILPAAAA